MHYARSLRVLEGSCMYAFSLITKLHEEVLLKTGRVLTNMHAEGVY